MKGKLGWMSLCLVSQAGFALQESPWYGDVYGMELHTRFCYSQYDHIDHAIVQPQYSYNNYVTDASISVVVTEKVDIEMELNMARTPHQTYGFRSAVVQARYQCLDDIAGDVVTLDLGLNTRFVTGRAVADVSSPYASYWNSEASVVVGKEITKDREWKTRAWAVGVIGLANHGTLWNRYKVAFEGRIRHYHALELFSTGYFGYGDEKSVDIAHFRGWGYIAHRSVDIGAQYSYISDIWGTLDFSYACRVFARSYPRGEQIVQMNYTLPFSLF